MVRVAVFCLVPLAAQAECLTRDDLRHGVRIVFANSDVTTIRALPDGRLEWDEYYAVRGNSARYTGWQGVYPVDGNDFVLAGVAQPGHGQTRTYAMDPATLPVPTPDAEPWIGHVWMTFESEDGGTRRSEETHSFRFLHAAPVTVDGCTYDAVGLEVSNQWTDAADGSVDSWDMLQLYLPALGAGFVVAARSNGDGPWSASNPVAIERAD